MELPVLIVGGGPVGLTASVLLSRFGVRSLLVERHPSTSTHPKARAINARTMEIYRHCGLEAAIRAAGLPPERGRFIIWSRTLAGEEIERRVAWRATAESDALSPVRNCLCAQDELEPVLRQAAETAGPGELRFATELQDFAQDPDGVTATLRDRTRGRATRVRARYLIAADGAQSGVRAALGIRMLGRARVYESVNVLLKADLRRWTDARPAALYFVEDAGIKGTFLTINGVDRWGFLLNNPAAYGLTPDDFTPERLTEFVRRAAGVADLAVEILGIAPWTASAHVAERYDDGRVFLAGDAAHEMPPTGGFGLNTGVQDVHNLAWKLAGVLHGWAAPALLDTYGAERQPVGRVITEQSLANSVSLGRLGLQADGRRARPEYLNEQGMIFGATYESHAVVPDGTAQAASADPVTEYTPDARPGARAPHAWLDVHGVRLSTIDLIGADFVLMTGRGGGAWSEAARATSVTTRVPIVAHTIGADGIRDPDGAWRTTYGVDDEGAVLVRPDGHVAWRSRSAGPTTALTDALARVLGVRGR